MSVPSATQGSLTTAASSSNIESQTNLENRVSMCYLSMMASVAGLNKSGNCREEGTCYFHRGFGQILHIGNEIFLQTVAHLFTDEVEEYAIFDEGLGLFAPFKYANPKEEEPVETLAESVEALQVEDQPTVETAAVTQPEQMTATGASSQTNSGSITLQSATMTQSAEVAEASPSSKTTDQAAKPVGFIPSIDRESALKLKRNDTAMIPIGLSSPLGRLFIAATKSRLIEKFHFHSFGCRTVLAEKV